MHYLDNAATTRVVQPAADAAMRCFLEDFGNPSSLHTLGVEAAKRLAAAREQIAAALGADAQCVTFTGCGSEGANLAILGAAAAYPRLGRHMITTTVEHACVGKTMSYLETQGYEITRIAPDSRGQITPEMVADAVRSDTVLVSVMQVNNETGGWFDGAQIAKAVKSQNKRTLFHSDGVQAFGKFPLQLQWQDIDLYSVSGHKIGAPKGVGALYVKKGVRLLPMLHGGGQEKGLRAGTESMPLICAFGAAAELAKANMRQNREHVQSLWDALSQRVAQMPFAVQNSRSGGSPYIMSLSASGYPSEVLLHFLEGLEVYVSSGSACSKGAKSPVLTAMGFPEKQVAGALRVSFCPSSTMEDVDAFCRGLELAVERLQH